MSLNKMNQKLKDRRKELGYSLDELAQITGYAKTTLHRYENNDDLNLGANKIQHLAECLGVTPAYLMGWESKEVDSNDVYKIATLLEKIGINIDYDDETDTYYLTSINGEYNISLSPHELKSLNQEIISFLKFKLSELNNRNNHNSHSNE
jgi:transcriptional regulator with XRE-family HTH domain